MYIENRPLVVGVVTRPETLSNQEKLFPFVADVAEVRLDKIGGDISQWISAISNLENSGIPVILTIRASFEGGAWNSTDESRLPLFKEALKYVSFVDIEYRSSIVKDVSEAAVEAGKRVILSYHDFDGMPSLKNIEKIITDVATKKHQIAKVATMVSYNEDVEDLESLLKHEWGIPISVIAMGDWASETRVTFPQKGSALTYGYIDETAAPGQISAQELKKKLG